MTGPVVYTQQAHKGRPGAGALSKVTHEAVGDHALACMPNGVKATTHLRTAPAGTTVSCVKCQRAAVNRRMREEGERARAAAAAATRGTRVPEGPPTDAGPLFDPWEREPGPIPAVRGDYKVLPADGARSITLGDLVALITTAPLDTEKPLRCLGRFDSKSTLGAMVSEDGSLVLMGVD